MKISARNRFRGRVVEVETGPVSAPVRVDIGGGNLPTSTITTDSATELGLEQGKEVCVVVKASEVMIATD